MTKRNQAHRDERRRQAVEVNLLSPSQGPRGQATRRRGCTLPFLGGSLMVIAFALMLHGT